jgi:hypothetical protein
LLGRRKLFIAQYARIMELGKLLKLGGQICRGRLLNRRCVLLSLRIGCALLISLIVLLLRRSILLRIFLLLVVVYCTGSADDDCCSDGSSPKPCYWSSHHWSSHHCSST